MSHATPEALPPKEHLERSLEYIRAQEAQMRRALQSPQGRLLVAIKHASQMLGELRTSALPPKPYYEVYNACFDALTLLQGYMREAHRTHHLTDVYEIVEYTGNVLPRLYLMITVGTAYLGSGDAPNQEVMRDMLEMCRGLQQPLRGMFLRYYLGQRTRDFLATASRADLQFSIQFTLTNFVEMNKLWVRYQHQGHSREFGKRMEERRQLQTVVGSNIYRLAQLDSVDLRAFRELVLPAVLEQVVQCRDPLAQEYLLDVVTQAFPAEYHLDTLDQFFECVAALVPQTSKRSVLGASLSRVYEYAKAAKEEEKSRSEDEHRNDETHSAAESAKESTVAAAAEPSQAAADARAPEPANEAREEPSQAAASEPAPESAQNQDEEPTPHSPPTHGGDNHDVADSENADGAREGSVADAKSSSSLKDGQDESAIEAAPETKADATSTQSSETGNDDAKAASDHASEAQEPAPSTAHPASESELDKDAEREQDAAAADKDSVDEVTDQTSELRVSDAGSAAATENPFSHALALYWHTIRQLELDSAGRAALVRRLAELSELVGDDSVSLPEFLGYVVEADLQPSPEFEELVLTLFDSHHSLSEILALLRQLPQMLASQSKATRHAVATKVLDNIVASGAAIGDVEQAKQVFSLFGMLLKTGDLDATKITQLLHLLQSPDGNTTLELLQLAYRSLREGGPGVVRKTFGVLANTTLLLLHAEDAAPALVGKALKFVNKVCHELTAFGESPLGAYRLYLVAVSAADYVGAEEAAYELFAEALTTYEEHISDSRQQVAALAIAIRALQRTAVFGEESFAPLAQRCQQSCQRLLKKPDQCRMLQLVATLYAGEHEAQLPKVSETLARALRVADSIMDTKTSLDLFLDLLESYLYFLGAAETPRPSVRADEVNSLLALIKQNFAAAKTDENDAGLAELEARMHRIHAYVQSVDGEIEEYQELVF